MKPGRLLFASLAAILATTGAAAQEPAAQDRGTAFAAATALAGEPDPRRPLARLRSPMCLVVAAEDSDLARTLAERIIDNARAAGVPFRAAGCRPNALVTISNDARAQVEAYRQKEPGLFRRLSDREVETALAARDPAYVFQTVQQTPRYGQGDATIPTGAGIEAWTKERSYLRTPEDLLTTIVMIEKDAIDGVSTAQLADYATLRLLAPTGEVEPSTATGKETILSLFADGEQAPAEMTALDRAYLRSLYSLPRTAFASEVIEQTVALAQR